jgi:hypothetical protein
MYICIHIYIYTYSYIGIYVYIYTSMHLPHTRRPSHRYTVPPARREWTVPPPPPDNPLVTSAQYGKLLANPERDVEKRYQS